MTLTSLLNPLSEMPPASYIGSDLCPSCELATECVCGNLPFAIGTDRFFYSPMASLQLDHQSFESNILNFTQHIPVQGTYDDVQPNGVLFDPSIPALPPPPNFGSFLSTEPGGDLLNQVQTHGPPSHYTGQEYFPTDSWLTLTSQAHHFPLSPLFPETFTNKYPNLRNFREYHNDHPNTLYPSAINELSDPLSADQPETIIEMATVVDSSNLITNLNPYLTFPSPSFCSSSAISTPTSSSDDSSSKDQSTILPYYKIHDAANNVKWYQCRKCPKIRMKQISDMNRHLQSTSHQSPSQRCSRRGCPCVHIRKDSVKRHQLKCPKH